MHKNFVDLTGDKYGKLTVVSYYGKYKGRTAWKCICDCGQEKIVVGHQLRSGKTSSCGCLYYTSNAKRNETHGMSGTRIYKCWYGMKQRCKRNPNYEGICVCEEWNKSFESFYKWLIESGYSDVLTLDRIDPYGNYSPENCRWVDYKTQENNRRNNRKVTVFGETHTLAEWSDITGILSETLRNRLESGWPEEDLFIKPDLNNKNIRRKRY